MSVNFSIDSVKVSVRSSIPMSKNVNPRCTSVICTKVNGSIRYTVTVSVVVSPSQSVAMTVIVFSPSESVTFALQSSVPFAGSPFTVTDTMPDASEAVPAMVIVGMWVVVFGAGEVMASVGGVVSAAPDASVRRITRPLPPSVTYA